MSKPSDTELSLLRALWAYGELSAREIHDASADETNWSFSSTRKTLDRMQDKGLVDCRSLHGVKVYAASEKKLNVLARLIRHFSTNILAADAPPSAAAFAGSKLITEDEIEELDALLKALDEDSEVK